ncbi:MAG: hypothetical protein K6U04_01015 [Armatimonadetes bacterium]|nr:hypothetical protein [Armatimonadota bacterium]
MEACPFGAMQFDEAKEVAVKCDLCLERDGKGPACAAVCPTGCIFFGDAKNFLDQKAEIVAARKRTL